MMMGMMVLMPVLVIAIVVANISYGYWNHSIVTELNPAIEASHRSQPIIGLPINH